MVLISWLAFFSIWGVMLRFKMGWRVSFLAAHVVNGTLILLVTEGLSVFQSLTLWPLASFWAVIFIFNMALVHRHKAGRPVLKLEPLDRLVLVAVALIVTVTGIIALISPPNNYDSLIYHMTRVAHWAHNGTVANYPTHNFKQLVIQPFSEYAILQSYILSGSDYFSNLVQWNSMIASLVGVSLIAGLLGGSQRVQLFAALFAATIPMGVLQASSTQNDYVATMWAVCTTVFALLLVRTGRWRWGVLCGLSLGLASITKGVAVTLGLPLVVWAVWTVQWKAGRKLLLGLGMMITVLAMNAAFFDRLTELDPNPFEAMKSGQAMVESVNIRGLVSIAVRGVATELALPSAAWNSWLLKAVEAVHRWLGVDVNDARFTVPGGPFQLWDYAPVMEDLVTNPLHSIIYLWVLVYMISVASRKFFSRPAVIATEGDRILRAYLVLLAASVLLFCAFTKWQAWITRFHLPFYVLFAAVASIVLDQTAKRSWPLILAGTLLFAAAMVPLFYNQQRSILPSGAITRNGLEKVVPRGGEVFDWMMRNGYFREKAGTSAYLNAINRPMRDRLQQAFPVEYEEVWPVLSEDTPSFSGGLFHTSQEELVLGRFGKVIRDDAKKNIDFIRRQVERSPQCRDIGYLGGVIEYPLWSLLNTNDRPVRIEHVLVDNTSRAIPYPRGEPEPCLLLKEGGDGPDAVIYKGREFRRSYSGPWQVYLAPQAEK